MNENQFWERWDFDVYDTFTGVRFAKPKWNKDIILQGIIDNGINLEEITNLTEEFSIDYESGITIKFRKIKDE